MTNSTKAFITYLDFEGLHTAQCQGVDEAGLKSSDYELWTPYDGRHGANNKCFLGQQVTYTRRKQTSKCFNGEDYEQVTLREPCACTEMDYACDFGYFRKSDSQGVCELQSEDYTKLASSVAKREEEMCDEYGYYEVSRGYRIIPGNICQGG